MTMTDPIADFLTRIRNAIQAHHKYVDIPASNMKRRLADILLAQKFIANYTNIKDGKSGIIRIYLSYTDEGKSLISGLRRISTPGLRKYASADELPRVRNNMGIAIISTSKGVMTAREAGRNGVGGEVICHVW
jgi:small subunit ribosomal protein S8